MAVPEQTPYIEHTGNGVTTSFSLGFQCETKDHLIVLVDDVEPPIATWSLNSGNVVFTTAPAAGKKITVQRNTPFGRTTDYQSFNNSFRPQTVNGDFDRLWLKLQELGVADWLMKLYVDRLHQQQEQKINDLKGYVDDRDDELRAYLMEEIRKQGVALDQLDEYYNYLMQRLAQIAVDKGWDASFVVDGDKNQHQINELQRSINEANAEFIADQNKTNELRFPVFSVKAFGAKGDGVNDDRAAIQGAIDACINNGGGTVYSPSTGDDFIDGVQDYSKFYAVKSTHPDYPNSGLVVDLKGSRYVRGNITFFGTGYNSRVELHTSNNIDYLMNIPFTTNYMNFDQFYLEANKKAKNALYMADEFHPFLTMFASTFRGGNEYAAKISTYVATLTNCIFTASTSGVRFAAPESLSSAPTTSLTLNSCYASGNTNIGFDFGYLTYCTLNACACDDGLLAYRFGIALGVTMNGCGTERTVKAIEVEGYRGFTINGFFMLNSGSSNSANPQPYLIEFKAGTDATISGIRYEGSSRYYTYKLASTSAGYGSENITVTDRSVQRSEIYFVENYAFARPIKLLRDDQTEKNRTYSFSNITGFVNHINLYGKDFTINHATTLNLSAGTYVLPSEINISNLDGKGELIIQGVDGNRSAVKIDTASIRLLLTNCSAKVRLKDLTLISTTSNTSARRLRVTNCPNVVLDNVHIDRNGVNTGYGVSAESGSIVHLINGTETTGPFATGAFVASDTSKFIMERRASAPTTGSWTSGMSFEYITPTTHRGAFYNGTAWTDYV